MIRRAMDHYRASQRHKFWLALFEIVLTLTGLVLIVLLFTR